MLKIILILLAIVVLISVLLVLILSQLGKRPDPNKSHNEQESYYDENGNHIYYDRKLIEHQKREQEHAAQNKK